MSNLDFDALLEQYVALFREEPPMPTSVGEDLISVVMERAIRERKVIPEDYDWWADIPKDSMA